MWGVRIAGIYLITIKRVFILLIYLITKSKSNKFSNCINSKFHVTNQATFLSTEPISSISL